LVPVVPVLFIETLRSLCAAIGVKWERIYV
jgi:hypothetical protein